MEDATLQVLSKCNITPKYKGYTYLPVAVRLADIYPVIGQIYDESPRKVERAIRKVVEVGWQNNREYMVEIMGFGAKKCPGNAQFIDALVYYISWKFNSNPQPALRGIV